MMLFEKDGQFGRLLRVLGKLQGDCPGFLLCYSTDTPGIPGLL